MENGVWGICNKNYSLILDEAEKVFSQQVLATVLVSTCGERCLLGNPFPHVISTKPVFSCKYLQGRLQVLAGMVASTCGGGCSALRLRWVKHEMMVIFR